MAKRKAASGKKAVHRISFIFFERLVLWVLVLFGFLLTAPSYSSTEGPGNKPPKKSPAEGSNIKTSAKKTGEQNSKQIPVEVYSYDSNGKPDPFLPLVTEAVPRQRAAPQEKAIPLTPLQKYDLRELNLVAIVALQNKSSAVLEDSAGFGYIVEEGMLIGKNDGIIKKINKNGLIIEEKILDNMGRVKTEVSSLTIQHQE